jgi:hypothetical protein
VLLDFGSRESQKGLDWIELNEWRRNEIKWVKVRDENWKKKNNYLIEFRYFFSEIRQVCVWERKMKSVMRKNEKIIMKEESEVSFFFFFGFETK